MSLHHAAQHLASKGRNGDTTLVHMTKGEVAGLQALAKKHGTSLTTNPHTGLPEAFSLKSLVPMAAGAALTAAGVPAPIAAGLVGFGTYAQSGSLTKGLMAGMGAYGGAGLTEGVAAAGTQDYAGQVAAESLGTTPEVFATPAGNTEALSTTIPPDYYASGEAGTTFIDPTKAQTYSTAYSDGLTAAKDLPNSELVSRGFSSLGTETGRTAALNSMGGGMGAAKYGLAAASPIIADKMTPDEYKPPEIKGDTDMGQRYEFESGYDNNLPGRTGQPAYKAISDEEAKKLYGFADGGDVQYPYNEPVVRMAEGGRSGYTGGVGEYSAADAQAARSGYGLGIDYSGYDTAPNAGQGIAAAIPQAKAVEGANPNQNIVELYKEVEAKRIADEAKAAEEKRIADAAAAAASAVTDPSSYWGGAGVSGAQGGLAPNDLRHAQGGGISTLGGYSDGGRLLRGPGDGVSDSIPAVIGRKQPARLADGEFVVPARIVSEIGNGSTEAGARKLYAMMDRVQKARGKTVGKGKVAKNTRADKFLPA